MFKVRPGVSRCGKFGFALFRPVCLGQALVSNHSRDRHGSIFDGAEWDELSCGKSPRVGSMLVLFGSGRSWQHMGTSLVIGTIASSRARRGMGYGQARSGALRRVMSRFVELCRGKSWPVLLAFGNHLHGRRGRGFDAARWDALRFVLASSGWLVPVQTGLGLETTIVRARRPIDAAVVGSGELVRGELVRGKACRVLVSFSTTPVQARFPFDAGGVGFRCCHGMARQVPARPVVLRRVEPRRGAAGCGVSWRGSFINQARAGTEPDQRRRLGMVCVRVCCVAAGQCGLVLVGSRHGNLPPSRSARRGFDASWRDASGYGQAGQGTAG